MLLFEQRQQVELPPTPRRCLTAPSALLVRPRLGFTFARSERRPAPTFCFPLINHFLCIGIEDGLDFSKRSDDVASAAIRRTTIVQ